MAIVVDGALAATVDEFLAGRLEHVVSLQIQNQPTTCISTPNFM